MYVLFLVVIFWVYFCFILRSYLYCVGCFCSSGKEEWLGVITRG